MQVKSQVKRAKADCHRSKYLASMLLCAMVVCPPYANAQISEVQAKSIAMYWFDRLNVTNTSLGVRVDYQTFAETGVSVYTVTVGESFVNLNASDGSLRAVANLERGREISRGISRSAPDLFDSDAKATLRANEVLELIGYKNAGYVLGPIKRFSDDANTRQTDRGRFRITFAPRPYGRDPRGAGNSIDMEFDIQDGALLFLRIIRGWTYRDSAITITEARAKEIAKALVIKHLPGKSSEAVGASLGFVRATRDFGSTTGQTLTRNRVSPYVYIVRFDHIFVYIDPATGECLGGAW